MIYVICLVVSIVSIILAWFLEREDYDVGSLIAGIVAIPTTFAAIIMTIIIVLNLCTIPSNEAKWQEQYKSLNIRIEQHLYYPWERNDLIKEVQNWNDDLAARQAGQNNFWISAFYPKSLDGLDKIELGRIK